MNRSSEGASIPPRLRRETARDPETRSQTDKTNGIRLTRDLARELAGAGLTDVAVHVDLTRERKGYDRTGARVLLWALSRPALLFLILKRAAEAPRA